MAGVHHKIPQLSLLSTASSLSCRMAIRATSLDARISHLICLVGVVNVQSTLTTVYQEDVVSNYLDGKRWGINDVLGFEIVSTSPILGEDRFHWAWLRLGDAELMLNTAYEFDSPGASPSEKSRAASIVTCCVRAV